MSVAGSGSFQLLPIKSDARHLNVAEAGEIPSMASACYDSSA